MKKKRRSKALGLALMASLACSAQSHTAGARLDTVTQTGFYRIVLPVQLVAKCKPDLADLRICRPDGVMIPYVLNTDAGSPLNAGDFPLPDPMIRQKDSSDSHSYIWLSYSDAYRIDRLSFDIRSPLLYKRTVKINNPDDAAEMQPHVTVTIDPSDTVVRIPAVKTRHLLIDIANADNAPLVVRKVAAAQSGIYIITHLEKGREYELEAGDSLARKPDYDLHYFTDSLRQQPMDIGLQPVYVREKEKAAKRADSVKVTVQAQRSGNTRSTILLWSVLVVVLLLLIYISVKMVKAIAKKETNDRL